MLRLFVSASIFVIALELAGLPARAQGLSDATSKSLRVAQNVSPTQLEEQRAAKSVACRKQAKEQKLSGSKRRAFLKDCMRK
jgi:psiF repeat